MARSARSRGASGGGVTVSGIFVRVLLWIGLPLALLYGLLWWRISAGIDKQLKQVAGIVEVARDNSYFTFAGDIGISGIRMRPALGGDVLVRARRMEIHTPGLWWLVRSSLFGLPDELPNRIGFSVVNLEIEGLPTGPQSGLIGAYTGLPMEAAGCKVDAWDRSDLQSMGLEVGESVLTVQAEQSSPGVLAYLMNLETPGVGSMEARMGLRVPGEGRLRPEALIGATLGDASVVFRDEGFLAARNAYCAELLDIPVEQFLQAHLDGVQSLLLSQGLHAEDDLLHAWGQFTREGGEFRIETRPSATLGFQQFSMLSGESLMSALSPYVRVSGIDPVRLSLQRVNPSSLSEQKRAREIARAREEDGVPVAEDVGEKMIEPVPTPEEMAAIDVAPDAQGRVPFDALPAYEGRSVVVETTWNTQRRGVLKDATRARLVLALIPAQGGFDMSIPRETVREVRILDAASAPVSDTSADISNAQAN